MIYYFNGFVHTTMSKTVVLLNTSIITFLTLLEPFFFLFIFVPPDFWVDAILIDVLLIKITSSSILGGITTHSCIYSLDVIIWFVSSNVILFFYILTNELSARVILRVFLRITLSCLPILRSFCSPCPHLTFPLQWAWRVSSLLPAKIQDLNFLTIHIEHASIFGPPPSTSHSTLLPQDIYYFPSQSSLNCIWASYPFSCAFFISSCVLVLLMVTYPHQFLRHQYMLCQII